MKTLTRRHRFSCFSVTPHCIRYKFYTFQFTSNIIRLIKSREEHRACMGGKRNVYRVLVGKPQETRWEDNIKNN